MIEKIYIGVAWPYANGSLHLGHIAGCYLPADIFARFNRMKGRDVLMVSGSDEHGTPITITAEKNHTTPQAIVDKFNKEHVEDMEKLGISFDLFTRTTTKNHSNIVQDVFLTLYKNNDIYKKKVEAFYCKNCKRFLPDRYIEGKCPFCEYERARGDQCDECGKLLDPQEMKNIRCKICNNSPEVMESEHLFFALSKYEKELMNWLKNKKYWKPSVINFTNNWIKNGLHDRAISRDIDWGVKIPIENFYDKRIYVWFDAVIGYLSASIEWSQKIGNPKKWEEWWKNMDAKHYYFLAKDNIPFHTLIWPSILIAYDKKLNLPYDIPANEYLRLKGEQFSKSRGTAVWIPDILKKFDVDSIRYYLSINMPENRDTDWIWDDFVAKNNDELVGTYGNFVHRVLTFSANNFGEIPKIGKLDNLDKKALDKIKEISKEADISISSCRFKQGLKSAMKLAQFGNFYFDQKKPWILIKNDKQACKTAIHICIKIINALAVFTAPYLPFSSDKLWKILGHKISINKIKWNDAFGELKVGIKLEKTIPLYKKLDIKEIEMEKDTFSHLDLRVAKVLDVKDHPNADSLYLMNVDLGDLGKRIIVAGMKKHYTIDEIKGKNIVVIINLKPATIRGVKSNGMLLAATDSKGICSLLNPGESKPGTDVFVKDIPKKPVQELGFEDFKKIKMTIDGNQKATYKGKIMKSEKGEVKSDKIVEKDAIIS
jgi:methionyl-tRNA synthetase